MKTQISNSLKDNMSSIQLKLNDFGLKDPIKKNTEELFKTKNTRPINQEYVYLNDPSAGKNVKQPKGKFISNWKKLYSQAIIIN